MERYSEQVHQRDTDLRWRDAEPKDVGRRAFNAAKWVRDQQASRELELVKLSLLYGGTRDRERGWRFSAPTTAFLDRVARVPATRPRLSRNAVRAVIDTAVAKVTGLDVRPSYLTQGGSWREQRLSKQLERYSDGQLAAAKMRTLGPTIFRDACWADLGMVHVYPTKDGPVVERVLPWEIGVDYEDGRYGTPWQFFRWKWINREELMDRFPKSREEIATAAAVDPTGRISNPGSGSGRIADQIMVVEAWYRSSPRHKGRHVIAIENHALLDEPWARDHFPFAFQRYSEAVEGFYGLGMASHLKGNQIELNSYLDAIQEHIRRMAIHIGLPESSRVVQEHINNTIMSVIKFADRPPVNLQLGDVPEALFRQTAETYRACFDQEGVPLLDSQSATRAGLNSEPSIRANRDIGTERFSVASKAYEQFVLDVSELLLEAGAEAADGYTVLVPGKRYAQRLKWSDVNLARDKYILRPFPTAGLPRDYAGRLAAVQDLAKLGSLDPTTIMRLLDLPDVDAELSLKTAALEHTLHEIDLILDGEQPAAVGPYHALQLCVEMGVASYQRAAQDGAPEDVLAALDAWIVDCQYRQSQGQPAPAANATPGLPGGAPQAKPEPLPTSPLLPQTGAAPAA